MANQSWLNTSQYLLHDKILPKENRAILHFLFARIKNNGLNLFILGEVPTIRSKLKHHQTKVIIRPLGTKSLWPLHALVPKYSCLRTSLSPSSSNPSDKARKASAPCKGESFFKMIWTKSFVWQTSRQLGKSEENNSVSQHNQRKQSRYHTYSYRC